MKRPILVSLGGYGYIIASTVSIVAITTLAVYAKGVFDPSEAHGRGGAMLVAVLPFAAILLPLSILVQGFYLWVGKGILGGRRWTRRMGIVLAVFTPFVLPLAIPVAPIAFFGLMGKSARAFFSDPSMDSPPG